MKLISWSVLPQVGKKPRSRAGLEQSLLRHSQSLWPSQSLTSLWTIANLRTSNSVMTKMSRTSSCCPRNSLRAMQELPGYRLTLPA